MPYLSIKTNQSLEGIDNASVARQASILCAEALAKPEEAMAVTVEAVSMRFRGDSDPAAFLELRALDLPDDAPKRLSPLLSRLMEETFELSPDRVYINFMDVPRTHWSWNGKPFA